jgi:hypothetical protein
MKVIEIPKTTGTHAYSLRAVGTADLLEEISDTQTIIKDMGTHFQIVCSIDVSPEQWKCPEPGFIYIWGKDDKKKNITKPQGLILDYEEEQRKVRTANKAKKGGSNTINQALQEQGIDQAEGVHREYKPASILASMRMSWIGDKTIFSWVMKSPEKALILAKDALANAGKTKAINPPKITLSQFFNPSSGKGVNRAKPDSTSPTNLDAPDFFEEWMKIRGTFHAMLPYRNVDDFKLFVIEPAEIGPRALSSLRKKILDLNLWGGIRLDIEATLRLAGELIIHSDVVQEDGQIRLRGRRPAEIIKGLRQAFFKSMGTAAALMNDAFLPLPAWFRIENRDDANAFLGIIREHIGDYENGLRKQGCLGSLDEKHSGDVPVLQQYRKWLTTGDKFDLLEFFTKYALHIMERRGKKKWVKEFSTENLTILFGRGHDMKDIVENAGFLSVARAIRNCTIYAVSLGEREPHFGLAQQWKQKIKGGSKEFVPVLCDFVQAQNWEVEHRLKGKGHSIEKKDLDSVIGLIEKFGAELIGMLLLAYGYARAPRVGNGNIDLANKEGK